MVRVAGSETQLSSLSDLRSTLRSVPDFESVLSRLDAGSSAGLDGVWGSACALVAATIAELRSAPLLIVLPRMRDVDDFAYELSQFGDISPLVFPAWETLPQERDASDAVFGGRLRTLSALDADPPPPAIVTSITALLQPVPARAARRAATRVLKTGEELDFDGFLDWLAARGFDRVPAIRLPGEFSVRGSIIDVFPPDAVDPLRIELFDDEIESLRRFDVETQRKIEELDEAALTLLSPEGSDDDLHASPVGREHLLESLPASATVMIAELSDAIDEAKLYLGRLEDDRVRGAGLFTVQSTLARFAEFPMVTAGAIASEIGEQNLRLPIGSIERLAGPKTEALAELLETVDPDEHILIACHNQGERDRLTELLAEIAPEASERVTLCIGTVDRGFRLTHENLVVIGDHELFNRVSVRRSGRKRRVETRAIDTFLDLRDGDFVVHLTNGIGRYRGMKLLEKDEKVEEHLIIEFRNEIKVFVPVSLIHLVQKYVGGGKSDPELSKIGSAAWAKKKEKVAGAVTDMAADMLQMQAARESKPGFACPPDSEWQREFAAAFPYTETEDQRLAIADVKTDLMRPQPMDRLICGDVGFGKTEVAMRGVFKTVDAGRQVAVLVPTTVLAEQHYRTFTDRMAEFPVTVESLSRFKSKGQQRKTLERMTDGLVDVVIGTHRLVSKDVRFKNLGLVIIDEEQKFGVAAKEKLKRLRLEVDVLTLSATPIPRTLHLSLLGVRDISNLTTPPQDRLPVETRVSKFDEGLIRRAAVRELNRGGQIYFVHNRVHDIEEFASRIQGIVPEARIVIGHGQMGEKDLEATMLAFVTGQADILVCTTIIESGLDIPNANTIFIDDASRYGLAELHQLRGRVGRDRHRAYCYLLVPPGKPLSTDAGRRLRAIEEFSELGAGFKIAMRDLEIRGAGNILGTQQSGHIASVGYELYCQLLENAVRSQKGMPIREQRHVTVDLAISGFIPGNYIPVARQKVEIYRRLSLIDSFAKLDELRDELADRFGTPPVPTRRLLARKNLQLRAWEWGIEGLRIEDGFLVMQYRNPKLIARLGGHLGKSLRIVDSRRAYHRLDDPDATQEELLSQVESLLPPVDQVG